MKDDVKIVSISDIHFGNKKVDSLTISQNLTTFLFPELSEANILFICGDVFDTMISMNGLAANTIIAWIIDLLTICDKYNITVRILRGTYTHDRDQSQLFETIHKRGNFKHDLRYIDVLSCEYIESYDMRVVYIPDNLPYTSSDECIDEITTMMENVGWDTVDYVIGHGMFSHLLPPNIPHPTCTFRTEQFKFVKYYGLFGHVHIPVARANIISNGSFERMVHGEEESKGFFVIKHTAGAARCKFIVNKNTTPFVTIDLSGREFSDSDSAVQTLLEVMEKHFPTKTTFGYVRIIHEDPVYRQVFGTIIRQHYTNLSFTSKSPKETKTEKVDITKVLDTVDLVNPTKDILPAMMHSFIKDKFQVEISEESIIQSIREI